MIDAQNAADLFETDVRNISLSPDGTMLAGTSDGQICVLALATGDEECFSTEDTPYVNFNNDEFFNPLVWSPDSTTLLFTEEIYRSIFEPDLWMLNVAPGEIRDLTDDGVVGIANTPENQAAILDYLPAYAPNGDIYFFRTEPSKAIDGAFNLTLQRLAVGGDEPEVVIDSFLRFPIYWRDPYFSPMISPDGTMLVFPVVAGTDRSAPQNGLWLVDLESGEVRQLTDADDTHIGLPESQQDLEMFTLNPVWATDGAGIVFRAFGFSSEGLGFDTFLYVDVATGDVRPVVDLSDFRDFTQLREEDAPELLLIPRAGAVSSDGSAFIYLGYNADMTTAEIVAVPLPPDGSEPVVLGEVEYVADPFVPNPTMSADGKALLTGWLYTFDS